MSISLPVELVSLIFSHIDWKADRKALKSLAITSSTFVEPCQRILFSRIGLTSSNSGRHWLKLFTLSPWIATYVKRITISESRPFAENWLQTDFEVAKVLRMMNLNDIRGFTLSRHMGATWESLSAPARRAIVDVCRSPALVDLDLHWAPVALVNACGPSLKHLRLFHCSGGAVGEATPIQNSPSIRLHSLELWSDLGAVALFLLNPSSCIRLNELHTLEVPTYSANYFPYLRLFVERSRVSLQTLSFRLAPDLSNPTENLSISGYPRLTNLELTFDACLPYHCQWAATFICSIPPSNAIQSIRLSLGLGKETGRHTTEGLRRIGRFIDTPGSLPHLQALYLELRTGDRGKMEVMQAWVVRALAISAARHLVHFDRYDDSQDGH